MVFLATRSKFQISTNSEPSERFLFEDAANAAQKFYLPHYGIATQRVSGQEQYWVSLSASGNRWVLALQLRKFPDPQLGASAGDAKDSISRDESFAALHGAAIGRSAKELLFEETAPEESFIRARCVRKQHRGA